MGDPQEPAAAEAHPALRIDVERSGGIAGLRKRWRVEADDVVHWQVLVEACPWDAVPDNPEARDRYVWRITVRATRSREARIPETSLTGPWRSLVDAVRADGVPA